MEEGLVQPWKGKISAFCWLIVFNLCSNRIDNDVKVIVGGKILLNERGMWLGEVRSGNCVKMLVLSYDK